MALKHSMHTMSLFVDHTSAAHLMSDLFPTLGSHNMHAKIKLGA